MIGERWQQVLSAHGEKVAIRHPGGALTFEQIDQRARKLDLVTEPVLAQGTAEDLAVALVAGFLAGHPVQVVEKDRTRRAPAVPLPTGTCLIKQTVGGSGVRRCQFFDEAQVLADVDRLHAAMGLAQESVCVAAISAAHSYGLTVTVLQTLLNGLPMHWVAEPFPAPLNEALRDYERVFLPGIPALWRAWLRAGVDLQNVTLAVSAGSPLTLELERRAFDMQGIKLHNLYGASECGAVAYDAEATLREDGSVLGTLLPGVRAEVTEAGLLVVQSDAVGQGYDQRLPGEVFGAGRFVTCDESVVEEGQLRFVQSRGIGINVAGRKLSPEEIAVQLRAATGVQDIHVRGGTSRDPERCQEVVAEVGLPIEQLTVEFRQRACAGLAPWEVPRKWVGRE